MTHRPVITADNLISGIDRVTRFITECIQLGETVLGRLGDSASMPYSHRNNSATYSDQVRVQKGNLCISDLIQPDPDQIQSDPTS